MGFRRGILKELKTIFLWGLGANTVWFTYCSHSALIKTQVLFNCFLLCETHNQHFRGFVARIIMTNHEFA